MLMLMKCFVELSRQQVLYFLSQSVCWRCSGYETNLQTSKLLHNVPMTAKLDAEDEDKT